MQLTRAADYAVRVMVHLASQPEGCVVSKAVLARSAEAPESFLAKILQSLSRAGLIQTRRGVEGGFVLLPRGAQASLLDVVEAINGPVALNVCLAQQSGCSRSTHCAAHTVWVEAQAAMVAVLRSARIADLVSHDTLLSITEKKTASSSNTASTNEKARQKPSPGHSRRGSTNSAPRRADKN
jgi:Rrf2 family protein